MELAEAQQAEAQEANDTLDTAAAVATTVGTITSANGAEEEARCVIGLCGLLASGKDTVADFLQEMGFQRASFAGRLKDVVSQAFEWDRNLLEGRTAESRAWRERVDEGWASRLGMPGLTPRKALQLWGTDVVRNSFHQDFWMHALEHAIARGTYGPRVVVTDCRFENEVAMIRRLGGQVWCIQRGPAPAWVQELRRVREAHSACRQSCRGGCADAALHAIEGLPHASEWSWMGQEDVTLPNDGTLESLRGRVHARAVRILE